MFLRRSGIAVTVIVMLCRVAAGQQASDDAAQQAAGYLFCGENTKGSVPVFAHPCEREPLRMAPCGTAVRVTEQDGDWLKLMFEAKDEAFVKAAAVSSKDDRFEAVFPPKQDRPYSTPECVGYMMAKAKGQTPKGRIQPPRALYAPDPPYPLHGGGVTGFVEMWLTIGVDGRVHDVALVKSLGKEFDKAAVAAAKTWRFEPARYGGKPFETKINVAMQFSRLR